MRILTNQFEAYIVYDNNKAFYKDHLILIVSDMVIEVRPEPKGNGIYGKTPDFFWVIKKGDTQNAEHSGVNSFYTEENLRKRGHKETFQYNTILRNVLESYIEKYGKQNYRGEIPADSPLKQINFHKLQEQYNRT